MDYVYATRQDFVVAMVTATGFASASLAAARIARFQSCRATHPRPSRADTAVNVIIACSPFPFVAMRKANVRDRRAGRL
jgi:hypothetical protein